MQVIKDNFLKLLVDLLLFPKNNITFPLNSCVVKLCVLQNIRNDVDCERNVFPKALRIVNSLFSRRIRVEMCSKVLYFKFKSVLRASLCALKCHMFEKMGNTIRLLRFRSTSRVNPNADCGSLSMWVGFSSYCQPIRQGGDFSEGRGVVYCCKAPPGSL